MTPEEAKRRLQEIQFEKARLLAKRDYLDRELAEADRRIKDTSDALLDIPYYQWF